MMQEKPIFIGSPPKKVRCILAEVSLVPAKFDNLRQAGVDLTSPGDAVKDSPPQLLLTNAEFPDLIGKSEKLREVCRRIGQVASTDSTVLIEGESGTGKELVARAIHFHSQRSHKPFIKVNCAALPETLIESELFGHVLGAFTGAVRGRKGRFAQADGGTILLDEIGSMPLASQAKFLRVLQEKEFEPLGSSTTMKVDVRVIATDNSDLAKAVDDGIFREDLYYRLSVFPLVVPPLHQRIEDVPLLAEYFLLKHADLNRRVRRISQEALEVMANYPWPGNVRQLENTIQHGLIVETETTIRPSSLPVCFNTPAAWTNQELQSLSMREKITLYEKRLIQEALALSKGKKKNAAQLLDIHPKNFSYLLHKHCL